MVDKKKVEIEVTKEINEVGVAVKKMVETTLKALEDGWQPSTDIPSVLLGSYKEFAAAVDGLGEASKEVEEAPIDAVMGLLAPVAEGVELILESRKAKEVKGAIVGNKKK